MKRITLPVRGMIALGIFVGSMALAGCDNIGNENPTSPQQMEDIRKKQEAERQNWTPNGGPKPNG